MADTKISDFATLASASAAAGDFVPVVDTSATLNKKFALSDMLDALLLVSTGNAIWGSSVFTIKGGVAAGLSGTAGTVRSFPATASKGKLILAAVANTGDTDVTVSNAAHGQATVYTIPDVGASTGTFAILELAQTHTAVQSFATAGIRLYDSDASHRITFAAGNESADRTLSIPVLGGNDTINTLGTAQTVTGVKTMTGANVITHAPTGLKVQDSDASHVVTIAPGDESANRTLNLPVLGGSDTVATIGLAQTFALLQTFTTGFAYASQARTATVDGSTTGTIATKGMLQFIPVTCDTATKLVILPVAASNVGAVVILANGATGYKLQTDTPASVAINGGTAAGAKSTIGANSLVIAICTSATTWQCISLTGTTLAAVPAAA